jgi:hypothetical protein
MKDVQPKFRDTYSALDRSENSEVLFLEKKSGSVILDHISFVDYRRAL